MLSIGVQTGQCSKGCTALCHTAQLRGVYAQQVQLAASVFDQTHINWEIIFWDNQSTDNSRNIVLSFNDKRIRYYFASTHESLYSSRNYAIEKADGDLIAFLDTDDSWLPSKLKTQVKEFEDDSVGVVMIVVETVSSPLVGNSN